jgi:hypothetical protein
MARMVRMAVIKSGLAWYFDEKANWRRGKFSEHPEDTRNERSAHMLKSIARYIERLPDDDVSLGKLAAFLKGAGHDLFIEGIDEGIFLPAEVADALANKAGFHCGEDPGVWFPWFIDQVIEAGRHDIEIELKADGMGPHEVQ